MESFLHNHIKFLDVHDGYYTTTIYVHYIFFLSFQFKYIRISSQPPLVHCIYTSVCPVPKAQVCV